MSEPFIAEIRIMSFTFAPKGWGQCNGQLLPINQNQALFSLLGTTYGGNGQTTFGLPDLRGRTPIHMGSGHTLGERAGTETVTLNVSQLPSHLHVAQAASSDADVPVAVSNMPAGLNNGYRSASNLLTLDPSTVNSVGGSQSHTNMMPYLVLTFCIALQGIFPSQY